MSLAIYSYSGVEYPTTSSHTTLHQNQRFLHARTEGRTATTSALSSSVLLFPTTLTSPKTNAWAGSSARGRLKAPRKSPSCGIKIE